MDSGLDLIELRVSREEARMLMTAVALRGLFYEVSNGKGGLDPATLTHYRSLGYKIRRQVDAQLGEAR